jgi:hypothetical protein
MHSSFAFYLPEDGDMISRNSRSIHTVEPGYKDISFCDTSYIASKIMSTQLIPNNIILLGYNDTRL